MKENLLDSKPTTPRRKPILLNLARVEAKPVPWLWRPYIPIEMLSFLSGDPGTGKTTLALAVAAALTRGEVPFSTQRLASPASVLYMTTENSPEYVLRPQFDLLGGDANRFWLITGTAESDGKNTKNITMKDVEEMGEALQRTNAKLVVLDPLQAYLGAETDAHRSNQTRPLLDGLSALANRYQCAILILRHLNKNAGGKAVYRGGGSIDFTGAARSEMYLEHSLEDKLHRIMAHSKTNLGEWGPSLVFAKNAQGLLICEGESELSADDLAGEEPVEKPKSKVAQAENFCREVLANGSIGAAELEEMAKDAGYSQATFRRAKKALNLQSKPSGFGGVWAVELSPSVSQQDQC